MFEETYQLESGQTVPSHSLAECAENYLSCSQHNPSKHPLRNAPRSLNERTMIILRSCEHGLTHPDPDEYAIGRETMHVCDGCCGILELEASYNESSSGGFVTDRSYQCTNEDCGSFHFLDIARGGCLDCGSPTILVDTEDSE